MSRIREFRVNNRTPPPPLSLTFTLTILIGPNLKLIRHLNQISNPLHTL